MRTRSRFLRIRTLAGRPSAPDHKGRRRLSAPRSRRLMVEQFEARVLLDAGPNTAPVGQNHIVTAVEDTLFGFAATDFPYTDAESNALVGVTIDTLPTVGNLTLYSSSNFTTAPVAIGQFISAADIIARNFRFQGALNASGSPYTNFTFQVKDSGGTAVVNGVASADLDPTPRTQTINVLSVNDPPLGNNKSVMMHEDSTVAFATTDFAFNDTADNPQNGLNGIFITGLPASGTVALSGSPILGGSPPLFIAKNSIAGLTFTPAANASGSASFAFKVQDDGGTAAGVGSDGSVGVGADTDLIPRTIAISITPVSDAPLGTDKAVTTAEDTAYTFAATDFGFIDPADVPPDAFAAVKITTLPASGALMVNGTLVAAGTTVPVATLNAGLLKFVPFPSTSGPVYASFTFQVQDTGSLANGGSNLDPTPNTISISVLTVNDPPASKDASVSYVYGGSGGVTLGTRISASSFSFTDLADFPENALRGIKITTLPASGVLTRSGTPVAAGDVIPLVGPAAEVLYYQPTVVGAPYLVQDSFQFQIQDDGGTANGGVDVDQVPRTLSLYGYLAILNDAPVAQPDRVVTIREDNAYTFSTADFDFTAPQDGDSVQSIIISSVPPLGTLRYLGAPVPAGMVIPSAGLRQGWLQFVPNANGNGPLYSTFAASVQDMAGDRGFPYTIGFNVLPVNDAPIGLNNTVATNEDTTYTFGVSDFGFSDYADSPQNNFYTVRIVAPPAAGLLTCGGVPVKSGDIVLAYDIAAGKLKFTPPPNAYGQSYASVSFRLQDDGGTANGGIDTGFSTSTLTINVTPVNDPPQGANRTLAMVENTSFTLTVASFGFSDTADLPLQNSFRAVEITTLPDKGILTLGGTAVVAPQFISAADINAGNLRFTPPPNVTALPLTSFTFQVEDNGGTFFGGVDLDPTPRTLTINVFRQVCYAPSGVDQVVSTLEDTSYAFRTLDFPESAYCNDFSVTAVRITSLPALGELRHNGVKLSPGDYVSVLDIVLGQLTYVPPANANGSPLTAFTFQVKDDGGTAGGRLDLDPTPRTMAINVLPVNDPPESADTALTTFEDTTLGFSAANFAFNDARDNPIPNSFRSLIITSLPSSGALKIGGTILTNSNLVTAGEIMANNLSQLTFTPGPNTNDGNTVSPSFTFRVRDNGGTANVGIDTSLLNYTATIRVTGVNDAPTGQPKTVTTVEDSSYRFATSDFGFFDANDQPPDAFVGVKITAVPTIGVLLNNGNPVAAGDFITQTQIAAGFLSFSPAANGNGLRYSGFTFQVKDAGGTANGGIDFDPVPKLMTINVTSVNDPPSGQDAAIALLCGARALSIADFGYSDTNDNPPNDPLGVKIVSMPITGTLTDAGSPVVAGQFISYGDLAAGRLVYTPSLSFAQLDGFQFQVQDNGGTANGGSDLDPAVHQLQFNVLLVPALPPNGIDHAVTTLEDHSYVFQIADFPFSDVNGNNLKGVYVWLPSVGTLLDNGIPAAAGDFISTGDIILGRFVYAPPANYNGTPLTSFGFQVQDDGGGCVINGVGGLDTDSTPNTLTINVTSVNDAPLGRDRTIAMANCNGLSYVFAAIDFGYTDPYDSPPNSFAGVIITTLPAMGQLTSGGVAVTAGQFVPLADLVAGSLVFSQGTLVDGFDSFTFRVKDNGGTANGGMDVETASHTLTLYAFRYLPPPPSAVGSTVMGLEDVPLIFSGSDFPLTDRNGHDAAGMTILSLPAHGTLRDNGLPVIAGQVIPSSDIVQGFLIYTPPPDAYGQAVASFSFEVEGDFGFCGEPSFGSMTINVTSVNDPPQGTDSRVMTLEDHSLVLSVADFPFSDPHDSFPAKNNVIGVKIATVPASGVLLENGVLVATGDFISIQDIQLGGLQFVPAANANGLSYASLTFQLKDDGGTASGGIDLDPTPRTIAISVTPVNDRPVFAVQANVNATDESGPQTIDHFVQGYSPGPAEEAGQTVHFVVVSNSHPELFAVQPAIDATGKLTFTPAANVSGAADISIVAQDDGGTANGGVDTSLPQMLTIQATKAHPGHNAIMSTDVTGDGFTTPSDALTIINFINAFGSQAVSGEGEADELYLDVNADGFIAPSDALAVINWINAFGSTQGEAPSAEGQLGNSNDWMTLLATDVADARKRR